MSFTQTFFAIASCMVIATSAEGNAVQPAVVRITSYLCNDPTNEDSVRHGTGILVQNGSSATDYSVVTNAHVPWHGRKSDGVCLRVETATETLDSECVDLGAADVLTDLAVVHIAPTCVSDKIGADSLRLADLEGAAEDTTDQLRVKVIGVPFGVSSRRVLPGLLYDHASLRHSVPMAGPMLEIEPANGLSTVSEYGMSGGAIASDDGTTLLGILTQQVLEISVGRPAVLHDDGSRSYGSDDNRIVHSLAIPVKDVARWLSQPALQRGHSYDLTTQKLGRASLSIDGLYLEELNCDHTQVDFVTGASVGGGFGVGIGGGNSARVPCELAATLSDGEDVGSTTLSAGLADLRLVLTQREAVSSPARILIHSVADEQRNRHPVHSLNQLLRDLISGSAVVVRLNDNDKLKLSRAADAMLWAHAYQNWVQEAPQVKAVADWKVSVLDLPEQPPNNHPSTDPTDLMLDSALDLLNLNELGTRLFPFEAPVFWRLNPEEGARTLTKSWPELPNFAFKLAALKGCIDAQTESDIGCKAIITVALPDIFQAVQNPILLESRSSLTEQGIYNDLWSKIFSSKSFPLLGRFWDLTTANERAALLQTVSASDAATLQNCAWLFGNSESIGSLSAQSNL